MPRWEIRDPATGEVKGILEKSAGPGCGLVLVLFLLLILVNIFAYVPFTFTIVLMVFPIAGGLGLIVLVFKKPDKGFFHLISILLCGGLFFSIAQTRLEFLYSLLSSNPMAGILAISLFVVVSGLAALYVLVSPFWVLSDLLGD